MSASAGGLPRLDDLIAHGAGPVWQRLADLPAGLRAARWGDALVLLRHADGRTVLGSRDFTQGILEDLGPTVDPAFAARRRRSLLHLEGPAHSRQRQAVAEAFKPTAVDRMRPLMRSTMRSLLDACPHGTDVDAVARLAHPYPIPVICAVLGVPDRHHGLFSRAADAWTLALFDPAAVPAGLAAHRTLDRCVRQLLQERVEHPADDLLSNLLAAARTGSGLSLDEVADLTSALLMAGTDTTRLQLGTALYVLAEQPDLWRQLREDPSLIPTAVEEIARLAPTPSFLRRVAVRDTDLGGLAVPAGTRVVLAIPAMNRDRAVHHDPDRLDLARPSRAATLSFGAGPHHCLGRQLGLAEIHEALAVLTQEVASLHLAGPVTWRQPRSLQGPAVLPVRLGRPHPGGSTR